MICSFQLFQVMLIITAGFHSVGAVKTPSNRDVEKTIVRRAGGIPGMLYDGQPKCEDLKADPEATHLAAVYCAIAHRDVKRYQEIIQITEGDVNSASKFDITLHRINEGIVKNDTFPVSFSSDIKSLDGWALNSDKWWSAVIDVAMFKHQPLTGGSLFITDKSLTRDDGPSEDIRPRSVFEMYELTGLENIMRDRFYAGSWNDKKIWYWLQKGNVVPTVIQVLPGESSALVANRYYTVKEAKTNEQTKSVILWDPAESKDTEYKFDEIKNDIANFVYNPTDE